MKTLLKAVRSRATQAATWMTILGICAGAAVAQTPAARITAAISSGSRTTLEGSRPPAARAANDTGRLAATTKLQGVTITFARSDAQEAALQELLAAQQNTASPLYHQWLTPDQFAARFGMADADLAKVEAWIEQQGMTVDRVARSKNSISFTGTAAQIEAAFATELHTYNVNGVSHFAPSTDLAIPAAMASSVSAVTHLSDFKPRPHVKVRPLSAQPKFTSSQTGSHYLTPGDIETIYNIKPAYTQGYTGAGQAIAVVGQSYVDLSDITAFQAAAGLTAKAPTLVLMPNSGTAAVSSGDEVESDLDLEYSGAIAPGATIYLVYTGNSTTVGAFDALTYAVDEDIAPIISSSYGDCETDLGTTFYTQYNASLEQAATQGQTVISAAGDDGSTDCYEDTNLTTTQREALAVDFPASSQYVTGIGGTEFPTADVASTNTTFWSGQASTDTISSALSYIPEQVWNDDSAADGLGSGGGGVSIYTARPSWQTALTSSITGSNRLVPDVSLDASPDNAGYLYCSSDATSTGITGSCTDGFRDANDEYLTVAGGTSFGAPIFAGMVALINQSQNSTGQGVVNPTLYTLAANATTYTSAFHDITSGNNECTAGAAYCSTAGEGSFSAATGYDEASGLGSINFYNLLTSWPAATNGSSIQTATFTTLTAATSTPAASATDAITITVATASASLTTSSETVSVSVDGAVVNPALPLTNGVATYSFSSATVGSHVITATYAGDTVYAGSTGSVAVTVGGTAATTGSFTVAATSVTVASGSSVNSTVTITPSGGYTGTVEWSLTSQSTLADVCYDINSITVAGTAPVTTTLTFYTSSAACNGNAVGGTGKVRKRIATRAAQASANVAKQAPLGSVPTSIAMASLLALGFVGRRRRSVKLLLAICMLGLASFAVSGCGSSSSSTTTTTTGNQGAGTSTITITGTDANTPTITSTATLTLTIN
jgi:subtilase family serine protease